MPDRSFHFIPSHRTDYLKKINNLSADHIIIDLEDGVPEHLIDQGKENILKYVKNSTLKNIWIRIHDEESKHSDDDLDFLMNLPDIGVVIPKFRPANWNKYPINKKKIILIESLMDLNRISFFSNELIRMKLFAIGLGLEDMLTDFYQSNESLINLINQIKAHFIIINKPICSILLDGVFTNYRDKELFDEDCQDSFLFGFNGRFSIHPNQIEIINKIYNVNEDDYKYAQKIISLSKNEKNSGYSVVNGTLMTPPKIAKSKTIIKVGSKK
jgi:citrate lyase subunit beta / citryl-CoA lyase